MITTKTERQTMNDSPTPRQYYYKYNSCKADLPTDHNCICWHDEFTPPLSIKDQESMDLEWRIKPMNDTPTPRTDLLTAKHWGDGFAAQYLKPEMQAMEEELTAAREELHTLRAELHTLQDELHTLGEQRDKLAEAVKYRKELDEWIENADPEDPFFEQTLTLGLNHASDLATEAMQSLNPD